MVGFKRRLPIIGTIVVLWLTISALGWAYASGGAVAVIFWIYVGIAAIKTLLDCSATIRGFRGGEFSSLSPSSHYLASTAAIFARGSRLAAVVGWVSTALAILAEGLTWPASLLECVWVEFRLNELARRSLFARHAMQRLCSAYSIHVAFVLAVVAGMCALSHMLGPCTIYRQFLFVGAITYFCTILLSYALTPGIVLSELKRRPAPVLLQVLLVVGLTYLTLTLSFAGLAACQDQVAVGIADIVDSAKGLLVMKIREVVTAWEGSSSLTLIQTVIGFLFYVVMLRLVRRPSTFKRNTDDYLWVAGDFLAVGEFAKALEWSDRVGPTDRGPFWFLSQAIGYLGLGGGNETRAVEMSRRLTTLLGVEQSTDHDPYEFLFANAQVYPIHPNVLFQLVRDWQAAGGRDAPLANAVETLLRNNHETLSSAIKAWVEEECPASRRPFTFARTALYFREFDQATDALRNARPATALERVYKQLLLLRASLDPLALQEDWAASVLLLRNWFKGEWHQFRLDAESVPNRDALPVASAVLWLVRAANELSPDCRPQCQNLFESLAQRAAKDAESSEYPPGRTKLLLQWMSREAVR
jgi:hypothetical protein